MRAGVGDAVTTESTDETQTLGEAIGLHQAGKLQDAAAIYHRLLAQHPTHFDALYFAGAIALQTGEIARGIDLLHRAIAADPGNIKASLLLASGLRTQHRHAEAVAVLVKCGADVAVKDSGGRTALDWARKKGHSEVEQLLQSQPHKGSP